jgi:hypothetical protein
MVQVAVSVLWVRSGTYLAERFASCLQNQRRKVGLLASTQVYVKRVQLRL